MNRLIEQANDFTMLYSDIKFGSVCSGIEAASVAWEPLGWRAAWLADVDKFANAVTAHHYPDVPNLGDMTALPQMVREGQIEAPAVFCGGTPCQAFSVAGARRSLQDERGNLSLVFCELADAIDDVRRAAGKPPAVIFWENVPGVLSVKDNAFGCFLAGLAGEDEPLVAPRGQWSNAGYVLGPARTVAWRILDAQYFGVAQRRRRVFVVASARTDIDPVQILFESDGLRRDSAPRREAREVAPTVPARSSAGGGLGTNFDCDGGVIQQPTWWDGGDIAATITTKSDDQHMPDKANAQLVIDVAHTLRGEGFDASEDGTGRGTPPVPIAFHPTQEPIHSRNVCHALNANANANATAAVAFDMAQITSAANRTRVEPGLPASTLAKDSRMDVAFDSYNHAVSDVSHSLRVGLGNGTGDEIPKTITNMQVRRLTPRECERLQGFPDDYTAIPWRGKPAAECPDGPRYKALGNSWAVPVVRWIGRRIDAAMKKGERDAAA